MVLDMTKGSPIRQMLRFFVPVLLGNLLQQLYNVADSLIVSRFLGVEAFSGVSATGSLSFLILGFALGICSGFAIPIAQEFGAGDHPSLRRYFANALYMAGLISVLVALVTGMLSPQILRWMGTPENIFSYSLTYIRIIFFGIPATVMYNLFAGVLRAIGDGRTPVIMLLCSVILNILLDLLFIITFGMGIAGAAYATVLSQLISCLLCLITIRKKFPILHIRKDEWAFDGRRVCKLLGIGVPMGLQFSITAIGSTVLQAAVNSLGSQAVAAVGVAQKVHFIFAAPLEAVGATVATYCGQNLGARRFDRVREGVKRITLIIFGYCAAAYVVQLFAGRWMIGLFVGDGEAQIMEWASLFLNVVVATSFMMALVLIYRNAIQGLGYSSTAMLAGITELFGRVFVALLLIKQIGFAGACFGDPVAWLCADLFLIPVYYRILSRLEKSAQ